MPEVREFIVGTPTITQYLAEQTTQTQLSNSYLYQHLDLLMTGVATPSGFTSVPTIYSEAPENLMQAITVQPTKKNSAGIADQNFYSANAAYARFREFVDNGGVYVENRSTINPTTLAAQAIATSPRVDFTERNNPDYAFDSRHLQSLYLNIRWAGPEALFFGGAGTFALSNVQVTIKARVITGIPEKDATGAAIARPYVRTSQQVMSVPQTAIGYTFQNMDSSRPLRRLFIKTTVGAQPYAECSDVPLGGNTLRPEGPHVAFRVNGSSDVRKEATYAQLRLGNARDYKMSVPMPPGHLIYEPAAPLALPKAQTFDLTADTQNTPTAAFNNIEFTYCQSAQTGS